MQRLHSFSKCVPAVLVMFLAVAPATALTIPAPRITSFTPATGTAGDIITITGTDLGAVTIVRFNLEPSAAIVVDSPTQIRAVVPPTASSGRIMVVAPAFPPALSPTDFLTRPTIQGVSPACGQQGTSVDVVGTNLFDISAIAFNGTPAPGFVIHNPLFISTVAPVGVTSGPVTATGPGGIGTSLVSYVPLPVYSVINENDSGAGSLRQAILDSNASPCRDLISFNIPGTGVHTISVATGLPTVSDPVTIDGRTQPGWTSTTPRIELSGASLSAAADGLAISGVGSEIYGLVINRFPFAAIHLLGGNNIVRGNFIGTDPTGMASAGPTQDGLRVQSGANVIGGNRNTWERNIIAGTGAPTFTTGGIILSGSTTGNLIRGNYLGVNVTGTGVIPGNNPGIRDWGSGGTLIGGTGPGEGNLIGGNFVGLDIQTSNDTVQGNFIGTDVSGTRNFSNSIGIFIQGNNHLIGGTNPAEGNVIASNLHFDAPKGAGIYCFGGAGNRFLGNSIWGNSGLGIDLDVFPTTGVNPNDPGDPDTGPNSHQNFPVLSRARFFGGQTLVEGTLNSTSTTPFSLEFFSNDRPGPTGFGPGRSFIGRTNLGTDASGNASFSPLLTGIPQSFLSSTATDLTLNNTSELSENTLVRRIPADMNFDANWDVIWRNTTVGSNVIWFMNGSTPSGAVLTSVPDANWKVVGIGDFQGDGKGDILWRHQTSGDNSLWMMDGSTVAVSAALPSVVNVNWEVVGVGDFQGDGKADILWRNKVSGDNSIWLMDGPNVAASATLPTVANPDWRVAAIGDLQGDGKSDIVWRNVVSGDNSVWFMDGMTMAVSATLTSVPDTNWKIAGSGDFQGDGKADLMWRNDSSGDNSVWLMDGPSAAVSASLPSVTDTNWTVARVGDFQGDGKADIFWRNKVTGSNSVWFMDGPAMASSASLPTVTDPAWTVVPK